MPFVGNPNVAMVELRSTWDGQKVENVLYFDRGSEPTQVNLLELAATVSDWYATEICPLQSNAVSFRECVATSLASETAPSVINTVGLPVVGGNANPALPNNVTLAIKFSTAGRGRASRGRNYILGITEESVTANQVGPGFITAYVSAYQALFTALGDMTNPWTWVVYSRQLNNALRAEGLAQEILNVGFVDNVIDSQRRRLPGRGS